MMETALVPFFAPDSQSFGATISRRSRFRRSRRASRLLLLGIAALGLLVPGAGCGPRDEGLPRPTAAPLAVTAQAPPALGAAEPAKRLRLVDLGADRCIPCRAMAPILEELRVEHAERLEVVFVDVWKNPGAGEPYGVQIIPTQIFYDGDGRELWRHQGFLSKRDILGNWKRLGFDLEGVAAAKEENRG